MRWRHSGCLRFHGDPQPLYNVPGRPALAWLAGLAFYIGLIVALIRLQAGRVCLHSAVACGSAGSGVGDVSRAEFSAHAAGAIAGWRAHRDRAVVELGDQGCALDFFLDLSGRLSCALLAVLVIGQTAWQTWNDYFVTWANLKEVRFQYNAGPSAVARYLDASAETDPVVLAGLFVDDSDPYNFQVMLRRKDLDLRWFDASSALPIPSGAHTMRIVLYDFTPLDDVIGSQYLAGASRLSAQEPEVFAVYRQATDVLRARVERTQGGRAERIGRAAGAAHLVRRCVVAGL